MTIKDIRNSTGLSQSKFCEALNIPLRSLQKWETGERNCPEYVVELIAYRVQNDPQFNVAIYVRKEPAEGQIECSGAPNYSEGDMKRKMLERFGADCEFLTLSSDKG